MHKTCSINYGHLADWQKTLPTTDLNKKNFHLIKYLLATFIFFLSFQSVLVIIIIVIIVIIVLIISVTIVIIINFIICSERTR